MDTTWLYGPRHTADDISISFGEFTINASDLRDLRDAFVHAGYELVEVRQETPASASSWASFGSTSPMIDVDKALGSDVALSAVQISGWTPFPETGAASIGPTLTIGNGVPGLLQLPALRRDPGDLTISPRIPDAGALDRLTDDVIRIITECGRRRIPAAVKRRALALLGSLLLVGIWVYSVIETWFSLGVVVLGLVAVVAGSDLLARALRPPKPTTMQPNRGMKRGVVAIDPLDRPTLRARRWNNRRDFKVGAINLIAGATVGTLLTVIVQRALSS